MQLGIMMIKIKSQGFTLIEVLMAVAILAILVAIAMPSYIRYVERGNVTNARAALIQVQSLIKKEMIAHPDWQQDDVAGWLVDAQSALDRTVTDKYDIASVENHIVAIPKADTGYKYSVRIDRFGNTLFCQSSEAARSATVDPSKCRASLDEL
ncbi:type IV pilin protein [Neisseria wadsworthii]|uniref:type IV pilin protein n=1 Tax=Neisseria wadsworthii TaxID=607711 RepID=UPI00131DD149|nr:prepilin-type N-terminal cleavage/methylation domain-containing protein [Neisseria wadsworthii]